MLKDRVAQSLCCPFPDWSEMISQRSFDTFCQMPVNKMRMHICICPLGCFLALPFLSSLSFLFWPLTGSFLVLVTHQLLFYPFLLLLFSIFHNHCRAQQGHKSHDVGHKETRGFHSTPHVTVKCCCWSAPKGVYGQCEGLDDHLRHLKHIKEERREKKIEKGKVLVQFLSQVNLCFLTLVAQLYSRTLELIFVEFVFVESKCHQYMR